MDNGGTERGEDYTYLYVNEKWDPEIGPQRLPQN
jgi:hypothetical protein